jgi:hypothetical protein
MKKPTPKTRPARKAAPAAARKGRAASPKAAAPKSPAAGTRPDGLRAGSKQALLFDLVAAPGGVTEAAACKKLGWVKCRVTIKRVVEKAGRELMTSKNGKGDTVYAVAPVKAGAVA